VDDTEYNQLSGDVNDRLVTTENFLFDWEVPNIDSIVMKFPIFSMLQPEQTELLLRNQIEKKYLAGEIIYEVGMTTQYVYIVTRGILRV
jgi:CRP-like cAMP-binding protein